jgi:hypothetical protein
MVTTLTLVPEVISFSIVAELLRRGRSARAKERLQGLGSLGARVSSISARHVAHESSPVMEDNGVGRTSRPVTFSRDCNITLT